MYARIVHHEVRTHLVSRRRTSLKQNGTTPLKTEAKKSSSQGKAGLTITNWQMRRTVFSLLRWQKFIPIYSGYLWHKYPFKINHSLFEKKRVLKIACMSEIGLPYQSYAQKPSFLEGEGGGRGGGLWPRNRLTRIGLPLKTSCRGSLNSLSSKMQRFVKMRAFKKLDEDFKYKL